MSSEESNNTRSNNCPINHPRCWAFDCNCKDKESKEITQEEKDLQEETTFFNKQISILELQTQVQELEARNKELEEAFGFRETWPITDVLLKLVESTEYLLDVKNYDRQGWEEVSYSTKLGRQYIDKINVILAEQALNKKL